jgi:hypothetical protein
LVEEIAGDSSDNAVDIARFQPSISNGSERSLESDALRIVTLKHPRLFGVVHANDRYIAKWMTHGVASLPQRCFATMATRCLVPS